MSSLRKTLVRSIRLNIHRCESSISRKKEKRVWIFNNGKIKLFYRICEFTQVFSPAMWIEKLIDQPLLLIKESE